MLTVRNVGELKQKFLHLDTRRQFEIGATDVVRILDYKGTKRWLFLVCHSFDKTRTQYGTYVFQVCDRAVREESGTKVLFHYQKGSGVSVIYSD